MNGSSLYSIVSEMIEPDPENDYYAITLLGSGSNEIVWEAQSHWEGFVDDDLNYEIRAASLVHPIRMARAWESIGESFLVVNNEIHLFLYLYLGGNALVEKDIAHKNLSEFLQPIKVAPSGYLGFKSLDSFDKQAFYRAPTPKHRMKILKRDGLKCRICGRSPRDYTDVELHVHHIRPWAKGGLTEDDNLITLCHTCHLGLDPHEDKSLFSLIDTDKSSSNYYEGVKLYRKVIRNRGYSGLDKDDNLVTLCHVSHFSSGSHEDKGSFSSINACMVDSNRINSKYREGRKLYNKIKKNSGQLGLSEEKNNE